MAEYEKHKHIKTGLVIIIAAILILVMRIYILSAILFLLGIIVILNSLRMNTYNVNGNNTKDDNCNCQNCDCKCNNSACDNINNNWHDVVIRDPVIYDNNKINNMGDVKDEGCENEVKSQGETEIGLDDKTNTDDSHLIETDNNIIDKDGNKVDDN